MKLIGFAVPAVASASTETFAQHLIVAGVSGAFGVLGVTLGAYIAARARTRRPPTDTGENHE